MNHQTLIQTVAKRFQNRSIQGSDIDFVKPLLNRQSVMALLQEILNNEALLQKICDRSYTHALGFDKIVLVDLSKDTISEEGAPKPHKTQVRLHIWEPLNDALPIVEALHEHSFDFVSTVLTGHLENQQFKLSTLTPEQQELLAKVKNLSQTLSADDFAFLNAQVEIMEALKLKALGSEQFDKLGMHEELDIAKAQQISGLSEAELMGLTALEGHYVSNRVAGERKAYKHVLRDYVGLVGHNVMKLDAGEYYFHPYQLPHRLYYDNAVLNSTVLITTPVPHNPEGGSLQRPTYVQREEQAYDKISSDYGVFRSKLEKYLSFLKNN